MKEEETTSRLEQAMMELSDDDSASAFIDRHGESDVRSFSDYYNSMMAAKGRALSDIVEDAGFGDYAYQIIRGIKRPVNRDHVIALCIASGMSVKETDRALRLAGHNALSPKDERDVRIVVCINKGMTRVMDVDLELGRFGLEPINKV